MLDPRARELVRQQLASAFADRRRVFGDEVKRIRREVAPKGAQVEATAKAAILEARVRFERAWEVLRRVMTDLNIPPSESLADDLKGELDQVHTGDLLGVMRDTGLPAQSALGQAWAARLGHVEAAIAEAKRRVEADIDLAVEAARRQSDARRMQSAGGPVTYNYFAGGTFGVVQTGANATANVVQSVGPEAKEALLGALEKLERDLEATPADEVEDKSELVELIRNVRTELDTPKPSRFKLTMWLSRLGATIQTAASLKAAYEVFRPAAAYFGIQLPPFPG